MAPSRGVSSLSHPPRMSRVSWPCQSRNFTSTGLLHSGHNRWSKIKHDKGKADAAKHRQRTMFAQEIATASKLFGCDPKSNPRLADLMNKAKKEGFAKASIEAAVARGQGRSMSGASLESVTIEGILSNNIAVIVECETDSKARTLSLVRLAIKEHGGMATPTSYLFSKMGRITFEAKDSVGAEDALESAIEAGAIDVDEDEFGRLVVSTEPGETRAVGDAISQALSLQVATSDILWNPNEDTKVGIPDTEAADDLIGFVDDLREKESAVQSIALNVAQGSLSSDAWEDLQSRIGV